MRLDGVHGIMGMFGGGGRTFTISDSSGGAKTKIHSFSISLLPLDSYCAVPYPINILS